MTPLEHVVQQMVEADLPPLPAGHPKANGKIHRFGPEKKGWYVLHEVTLKSGTVAVWGAFGYYQGENRNTIKVRAEGEGWSDQDRAEYIRKQREQEDRDQAARDKEVMLAANRAKLQWAGAVTDGVDQHPYLIKKAVPGYGLRIDRDGLLFVPLWSEGGTGDRLMGLQKIDAKGEKRYNQGIDKIGAGFALSQIPSDAPVIAIGEGFATCASVHMVSGQPVVATFDAGSILHVARALRAAYPAAHLLFLADDDYLIVQRLIDALGKSFKLPYMAHAHAVTCGYMPVIDGTSRQLVAADGELVDFTAWWRSDAQGVAYIEADIRKGRISKHFTFKNAGVSSCKAAAAEIGNASVVAPVFACRNGEKWTDFNDLQVEQSIDAVASQINHAFDVALGVADSPAPSLAGDFSPGLLLPPAPPAGEEEKLISAAGAPRSGKSMISAAQGLQGENEKQANVAEPPQEIEEIKGLVPLAWVLSHCALIQGSTDVWDSVNKLRIKKAAFVSMVGKAAAKEWEEHKDRRSISPRTLPKIVRGVAKDAGGAGDDAMLNMLDRYTLLYGTKAVWDSVKKDIVNYDAMALARGDLALRWLTHPSRREIDHDKLVFDPTQKVDPETHINMFEGFPIKPKNDDAKVSLVLRILESLCSSEPNGPEVFEWVLKWLAYPLQHPGAKMQTALLFFGQKQGTGKSLFFEGIVKPLYGKHGATGGQNQLDSTYSFWRSKKLYVLFEEILSRQDKYSSFGLVKHLITGRDTSISQKFKDDRHEANHLNVVMLSNEFQPVPIEPDDRRMQVVEARQYLDAALLAEVSGHLERDDGIIEAFYDFLLRYPLGDFNPHAKPLMTASKQRMIDFGLPDWQVFYQEWASLALDVPYCTCLSEHLFEVYKSFCSKFHFRALTITKFSELMSSNLKKDRQWVGLGTKKKKLLTVFHVPSDIEQPIEQWCQEFMTAADIKV